MCCFSSPFCLLLYLSFAITEPSADALQLYHLKAQIRHTTATATTPSGADTPASTASKAACFVHPLSRWISGEQ